jgi:hypothetical protein
MVKVRHLVIIALSLIGISALIVFVFSKYVQPTLSPNVNSTLYLIVAAIVGVMAFLAEFKDIIELADKLFSRGRLKQTELGRIAIKPPSVSTDQPNQHQTEKENSAVTSKVKGLEDSAIITSFLGEFAQETITITQEYIKHVSQALYPNTLDDFLTRENLPRVPRPLEWWEKVLATGKGPRGTIISFLNREKALRLLNLSTNLKLISRSSSKYHTIILLIEEIYDKSEHFPVGNEQAQKEYREQYLREHIDSIVKLHSKTSKIGCHPS